MKKIQLARFFTQILFVALTVAAILNELPIFKIAIIGSAVLGGVYYCGWACSFGFLQDIGSKLGKMLGIKKRQIPKGIHQVAVYLRYVLAVATAAIASDLIFTLMQFEARGALLGFLGGRVPTTAALVSIGVFFLLSVKYDRVYCKYVCPEGGRYGLMSLLRPFSIKRNAETCVNCGKCDTACPMQINVSKADKLRSPQCVNCFECLSACPVEGAMEYGYVFAKSK